MKKTFRIAACTAFVSVVIALLFFFPILAAICLLALAALSLGNALYLVLFDEDVGIFGGEKEKQ